MATAAHRHVGHTLTVVTDVGHEATMRGQCGVHLCGNHGLDFGGQHITGLKTLDVWHRWTVGITNHKALRFGVIEHSTTEGIDGVGGDNHLEFADGSNLIGERRSQELVEAEVVPELLTGLRHDRHAEAERRRILLGATQTDDHLEGCGCDLDDRLRARLGGQRAVAGVGVGHGDRLPSRPMTVDPYLACPLPAESYVAVVRAEAQRFAAIAAQADLATSVTSCGDWTLRDLIRHVGFVHRWATSAMMTGDAPDRGSIAMPANDEQTSIAAWFSDGAETLVSTLTGLDPTASTWHPFPPPATNAVWLRRMAHETMIHRTDAELALGEAPMVEPEIASDGIDEYLSLTLPHLLASGRAKLPNGSIHLHCTDVSGEWLVVDDNGLALRREHAKGDAAVRGPAAAILADLWGRRGRLGEVEVVGDAAVAEAWLAIGGN